MMQNSPYQEQTPTKIISHQLNLSYEEYIKHQCSLQRFKIGEKYVVGAKIDENQDYRTIYIGHDLINNRRVAVKLIDLYKIEHSSRSPQRIQKLIEVLIGQWSIMASLNSIHIVEFYDFYQSKELKLIFMEYCNEGTLSSEIYNTKISEQHAIEIMKQLIRGLSVMHNKGIIHRDIKSENIMRHNKIYKFIDFGSSKKISNWARTTVGTLVTMAPEVLERKEYDFKADIWSLGIIMFQILTRSYPFPHFYNVDNTIEDMLRSIKQTNIQYLLQKLQISQKLRDLLNQMLQYNPQKRINWTQLLFNQLFQQNQQLPQRYQPIFSLKEQIPYSRPKTQLPIPNNKPIQPIRIPHKEFQKIIKNSNPSNKYCKLAEQCQLECKKTEWILKNIFEPLQKIIFGKKKGMERVDVQLLYLLVSRCFCNMSFIRQYLTEQMQLKKINNADLINIQILNQNVLGLYIRISTLFDKYSQTLTKIQNKKLQIFKDFISKRQQPNQYFNKLLYLSGTEINPNFTRKRISSQHNKKVIILKEIKYFQPKINQLDSGYTKQQQIQYTYGNYLVPLVTGEEKGVMDGVLVENIWVYQRVNQVTVEDMKDRDFSEMVSMIKESFRKEN